MRYSRLNTVVERRLFDPSKKLDQLELQFYIKNGRWKDKCPFYAEHPWEDIPAMCKDKYTSYQLLKIA